MGIMRWTLLDRVRKAHPGLPVENTYGYLTKHTRITHGLPKTHCVDAYCIAGNLKAVRRGVYLHPELPAEITLKPYGDPRNVMISR